MEIEIAVRDGQKVRHVREIEGATRCLAEQRLAVGKRHERLRRGLARKRPQARTVATGENQRNQLKGNHRHEEKMEKIVDKPHQSIANESCRINQYTSVRRASVRDVDDVHFVE